jgi:ribulose-phosphate 3-epimerase
MSHLIAPSLLAADFGNLKKDIELVNRSQADWLHLDIMDGVFVPNISFGFPVLEHVRKYAQKPLDAHLMIVNPDKFLKEFSDIGIYNLTVHYEAFAHLHTIVQKIKSLGMKAGISLNPYTPVNVLEEIITEIDLVLIMSVNPGYGAQEFIPQSFNKIKKIKKMITRTGSSALIQVDGGVTLSNAKHLVEEGVNVLVAGTTVFNSNDPLATIKKLKLLK